MYKLPCIIFSLLMTFSCQVFAANKYLVGHFFEWHGNVSQLDTKPLTHLVYNHLELTPDANIQLWRPEQGLAHLAELSLVKQRQPDLVLLASIGGWALSKHYPEVVADPVKVDKLVKNIGQFIANSDFDGISIDWRYPGVSRESSIGDRDRDGLYLLALLKKIRQHYPQMPLITPVSVFTDDLAYLPLIEISRYVDFLEVLSLDLAGHWQNQTGHASPLYTPPNNGTIFSGSVNQAIEFLLQQQVPANKLMISLPAFGHGWMGVAGKNHGLFQASQSVPSGDYLPIGSANSGLYTQASIQRLFFSENYQSFWDQQAKASYLFNPQNGHFISFESTRSLKAKVNYIRQQGLVGLSVQDLAADASLVSQAANLLQHDLDVPPDKLTASDTIWFYLCLLTLALLVIILSHQLLLRQKHKQNQQRGTEAELANELLILKQQLACLSSSTEAERQVFEQQLIQKQQQLSQDPSLLSELHKISSNKNKLLYIQAEKGYTGLYMQNKAEPEYIYSRLKQLKQYYDDDFLLQIHRSYLVNPQKVEQIEQQSDSKFVVIIAGQRLPIGGSFIDEIKQKYSHWFD